MNIDYQRLRNLTTGRLHTVMDHIYLDLEALFGTEGIMTHMIPNACDAVQPFLRRHVTEPRFWDGEYDREHEGEYELPDPTEEDRQSPVDHLVHAFEIELGHRNLSRYGCYLVLPGHLVPVDELEKVLHRVGGAHLASGARGAPHL